MANIVTSSVEPVEATLAPETLDFGPPPANWRESMKRAIRDPEALCQRLGLGSEIAAAAKASQGAFPTFAPLEFVSRMKFGDPRDPLLLQVLPQLAETESVPGFLLDPVGDMPAALEAGVLQKYQGRALLVTTGACAVHCRYCFRRHFPYDSVPHSPVQWKSAIDRLTADSSIEEVLLSGGDPLTIVDYQLKQLVDQLAAIPHLRRLRIHSRLPIMIPGRVDDSLLEWISSTRLAVWFVLHINHANELDAAALAAISRLRQSGVNLLNQAVLLRGINDQADDLVQLCGLLVDHGVLPYYLHQLDKVAGAAHFEVPLQRGREIMQQLRERLPGYAVPKYVQEIAGQPNKTPCE